MDDKIVDELLNKIASLERRILVLEKRLAINKIETLIEKDKQDRVNFHNILNCCGSYYGIIVDMVFMKGKSNREQVKRRMIVLYIGKYHYNISEAELWKLVRDVGYIDRTSIYNSIEVMENLLEVQDNSEYTITDYYAILKLLENKNGYNRSNNTREKETDSKIQKDS